MTKLLSVVETPAYLSKASKLLNENERAAVVDMIAAAPNLGVVMRGTGGLRKMRIPLMGRGKRGGGRPGQRTTYSTGRRRKRTPGRFWRTKVKKKDFDGLMRGLREARAYARGKPAAGTKIHVRQRVDVVAVRTRTGLSQDAFARRIGVSVGTLRNWEQGRRRPDGPAMILLSMLERDPHIVERTLANAA
jgi:putative transcriptional regulator